MNASELREALEMWQALDDAYDKWQLGEGSREQWGEAYLKAEDSLHVIEEAARERLAQLEGDEKLVERIAQTVHQTAPIERMSLPWNEVPDTWKVSYRRNARDILDALITIDEPTKTDSTWIVPSWPPPTSTETGDIQTIPDEEGE